MCICGLCACIDLYFSHGQSQGRQNFKKCYTTPPLQIINDIVKLKAIIQWNASDNFELKNSIFFQPLIGPNDTWCLGRPTMDGKTARGASSPANPALHIPDPLSITIAATSSLMFLMKMERQPKFSLVRSNAGAKWKRPRVHPGTFKFQDLLIRNYWRQGCTPKYGHFK